MTRQEKATMVTEEHETYTCYMVSWSPKVGEATYSKGFDTPEERITYIGRIAPIARSIYTWDKECWRFA